MTITTSRAEFLSLGATGGIALVAGGALLAAGAGPVGRREQRGPGALPLDGIVTEVADRAAVVDALDAELARGPATGFSRSPSDDEELSVSFVSLVVRATRT
jgi:hypothetical protein